MTYDELKNLPERERLKIYDNMLDFYGKGGIIELTDEQITDYLSKKRKKRKNYQRQLCINCVKVNICPIEGDSRPKEYCKDFEKYLTLPAFAKKVNIAVDKFREWTEDRDDKKIIALAKSNGYGAEHVIGQNGKYHWIFWKKYKRGKK